MSKFERYKKGIETEIYPHKHCKNCGEMIDESVSYCEECYKKMKEKKKKRFRLRKRRV